jgi:hypothetical protein
MAQCQVRAVKKIALPFRRAQRRVNARRYAFPFQEFRRDQARREQSDLWLDDEESQPDEHDHGVLQYLVPRLHLGRAARDGIIDTLAVAIGDPGKLAVLLQRF